MFDFSNQFVSKENVVSGEGLINTVINKLPVELHLPGYQYCGPGTKLQKRLARGDPGINLLDQACKQHDISYSKFENTSERHKADKVLAEEAWKRVTSKDAGISERANAMIVTNLMKAKVKLGMGCSKSEKTNNSKKIKSKNVITFNKTIKNLGRTLQKKKPHNLEKAIKVALSAAKKTIQNNGKNIKTPRVISVPKIGGVIPFLVPLFAGLSALGALSGGVTGIAKAINDANNAKKELDEKKRHNKRMEAISVGNGLHLKPYRKGLGLYLSPQSKNL